MTNVYPVTGPDAVRPTPVIDYAQLAARISGLVVAVGAALTLIGLTTDAQVSDWATVLGGIITAGGAVVAYVLPIAQAKKATALVTPVEDPRDDSGNALVPSTVDLG